MVRKIMRLNQRNKIQMDAQWQKDRRLDRNEKCVPTYAKIEQKIK